MSSKDPKYILWKARNNVRDRARKAKQQRDKDERNAKSKRAPIRGERIDEPYEPEPMNVENEPFDADETRARRVEKKKGKKPVEDDPMDEEEAPEEEEQNVEGSKQDGEASEKRELTKSEIVYKLLVDHDFMGTKFPHTETMEALGIREEVELVFKNMGLSQMMRMYAGGYQDETCQFLATLQLHAYDDDDREDFDNGMGWITFTINRKEYSLSYRELDTLYGFESGEDTTVKYKDSELKALWRLIAQGHYSPSRSKSSQIRSPVLRYVHKALANTYFARTVTGHCTVGEIQLLDKGLMPIVKRLGKVNMVGDQSDTGLLGPFLDQLMSYQDTTYTHRDRRTKASLYVGGIITPILMACHVPVDENGHVKHSWLDLEYLKRARILDHKEVDGQYVYKYDYPTGGLARILLPNQAHTKFRNGRNVNFHPPRETLYQLGQGRAAPTPMEEDIQEDEEMSEPERYFFEEYPYQESEPAVAAAHKRIGFLQKLNKWHIKKVDQLKQTVSSMAKSIKNLERKVKRSTTKKKAPPPFLRSRSLIQPTRRPSTQEPPRASSFEPREAQRHRQKKRRSSSSCQSDFTGGLDRVKLDSNEQFEQAPPDFNIRLDRGDDEGPSHTAFGEPFDQAQQPYAPADSSRTVIEYSHPSSTLPPELQNAWRDIFGYP